MNALFAFPIYLRHPEGGMHAADTAAMDWFVIATLCFFFFLLGCFAMAACQIWRRTTRPDPHVQLLMELAESDEADREDHQDENAGEKSPGLTAPREPWEQAPDWWKQ